jgi:hypothetical protein
MRRLQRPEIAIRTYLFDPQRNGVEVSVKWQKGVEVGAEVTLPVPCFGIRVGVRVEVEVRIRIGVRVRIEIVMWVGVGEAVGVGLGIVVVAVAVFSRGDLGVRWA